MPTSSETGTAPQGTGRRGLTITEVVVVLAIIGFLYCLIIPALARGRAAADRVRCMNNLKQIILALHNYESEHQSLPPGCVNPTGPIHNRPEGLHTGWIVQILPHMEQGGLASTIDPRLSIYDAANRAAFTKISILVCPLDGRGKTPAPAPAPTSYAGCHHDVEAPIDEDNHGVLYLNSHVRRDDVTDGTSHTFYVGEMRPDPNGLGWGSGTRSSLRNTGTVLNGTPPGFADSVGGFGSGHPGGAHFAFGDGSVRFVSDRIDPAVYQLLGHRADGEPVSDDAVLPRPSFPLR